MNETATQFFFLHNLQFVPFPSSTYHSILPFSLHLPYLISLYVLLIFGFFTLVISKFFGSHSFFLFLMFLRVGFAGGDAFAAGVGDGVETDDWGWELEGGAF